jgi:AcrR family transcriptional regulator
MHVCIYGQSDCRDPERFAMRPARRSRNREFQPVTPVAARLSPQSVSRQRARTEATRRRLLTAAEDLFARDGFEATRIEDIAASAGYTRGAFYANFDGKEDIFFALVEQWIDQHIAEVEVLLERGRNAADRLRALRDHYARIAKNRRYSLLSLEFKLFAIRHPGAHARLRTWQRRLRTSGGNIVRRILREQGRTLPFATKVAAGGLGALSNALFLEHLVDHAEMTESDVRQILGLFFDAIFGARTSI